MVKIYGFEVNEKQTQLAPRNYQDYINLRIALRESWNTKYKSHLVNTNNKLRITPFRALTNSGDLLSRQNYSCQGSSLNYSTPNVFGLRGHLGSALNNCDTSGVEASNCNVKYVYDSSDYVTYLKQKALINKNN